jgi:hypothetical protein
MNKSNSNLVNCNLQVSPALARRFRKAVQAEENGHDPRNALMIAADCKPNEITLLRARVEELSFDLDVSENEHAQLNLKVHQSVDELSIAHTKLSELNKAKEQIVQLEETLSRSVNMQDLPDTIANKLRAAVNQIVVGDDPKTTFLAVADYDRHVVDEAMSAVGALRSNVKNLEVAATPLREVLGSGGIKAWIVRRVLSLR